LLERVGQLADVFRRTADVFFEHASCASELMEHGVAERCSYSGNSS